MSVKLLCDIISNDFKNISVYSFYNPNTFLWGKARKDEDGNFWAIQLPVSCKDYVVDTYYTAITGGFKLNDTNKKYIYDPYFYIICDKIDLKKKIIKRVKTHINVYEKKHGFIPTVVHDVECELSSTYGNRFLCFEYDPKWMINATAMSIYLSMVRSFIYTNQLDNFDVIKFESTTGCNEHIYYNNLQPHEKHLISYLYNNPNLFIVDLTKHGYKRCGFKHDGGHGASGLFFCVKQIVNETYYSYNTWKGKAEKNCCNNWIFNIIHKYATGYSYVDYFNHPDPVKAGLCKSLQNSCIVNTVDGYTKLLEHLTNGGTLTDVEPVQSVQQKVVRKRAIKKVPKQGTESMLLGAV